MGKPECAVCGRPVDSVTVWRHHAKAQDHYIVRCHGKEQRFAVNEEDWIACERVTVGRAFERTLETPQPSSGLDNLAGP